MRRALLVVICACCLGLGAPSSARADQGHEHQGHEAGADGGEHNEHGEHNERAMPAAGAMERPGYIRVTSPAGYEVVIGRPNPLWELPCEVVTDEEGREVKIFRLTVEDVEFEIYPGKTVQGWGFGGRVPGPTIRAREGDRIRIVLTNKTKEKHTIHLHGQRKSVEMDGVPYLGQKPVGPDETFTYEFVLARPGTHWYHCHVDSAHHVDVGMYGALIVEPREETLEYDIEYTWILDEWPSGHVHEHGMPDTTHEEHSMVTLHRGEPRHEHEGETPPTRDWYPEVYKPYEPIHDTFIINGRAFPYTEPLVVREGRRVRIRLINAGYEPHYIHTHAHRFQVVARDGNPVADPQMMDTVEVGPGQRVDILMLADNPGIWPVHCHRLTHVANDKVYPGGMLSFIRYVE